MKTTVVSCLRICEIAAERSSKCFEMIVELIVECSVRLVLTSDAEYEYHESIVECSVRLVLKPALNSDAE